MKKLHKITISINGGYVKGNHILYIYSNTEEASVILCEQAATIVFTSVFDVDTEDLAIHRIALFQDAYRKIHLIHLFAKGDPIHVDRIDVKIDNDTYSLTDQDSYFPYIISMLEGHHFELCEKWRSEHIYDAVSLWPIVASESNLIHCAVSAFLSSKTRRYLGDRLLDLWTAFNSYFSYIAVCYENTEAEIENIPREALSKTILAYGSDAPCIGLLCMKEFRIFLKKHTLDNDVMNPICLRALKCVSTLNMEQLPEIYLETESNFDNNHLGAFIPDALYDIANEVDLPLHLFLLIILPYYLRCELVHGSRSTPILCQFFDEHLLNYRVSCYYLEHFLDQKIPEMFNMNDRISAKECELLCAFLRARHKGKDGFSEEKAEQFKNY